MSWSVSAIGKASAVAAKLATDFAAYKCSEPEETIKQTVAAGVAAALAVFPPQFPVQVEAFGSQQLQNDGTAANNVSLNIKPLWNFLE